MRSIRPCGTREEVRCIAEALLMEARPSPRIIESLETRALIVNKLGP